MARLPTELTDIIIALLSSDPAALRACSLVCKNWLPTSRCHLFSTIILTNSSERIHALVELLTTPLSTLPRYVQTVDFQLFPFEPLPTMAQPLEKLVGVETLILRVSRTFREWGLPVWFAKITTLELWTETWCFDSPKEFFTFLCSFCSLRVLDLRNPYHDQRGSMHTLSFPSSLRVIKTDCGFSLSWLIPYVKNSALSELRLSNIGRKAIEGLRLLLHSCGPSIQLLDFYFEWYGEDIDEQLDLSCLSNLQVLRIDGLGSLFRPSGVVQLSKIVSRITSEHMAEITLRVLCALGPPRAIDEEFAIIDWMKLDHALSHPRFARLQRVEIEVRILDLGGALSQADEWTRRVRAEMGELDSRGCLFVLHRLEPWSLSLS